MILFLMANIREEEMDDIEAYVKAGGNLLISGPIANPRLQKMLGVRVTGKTAHNFTYMSPDRSRRSCLKVYKEDTSYDRYASDRD